MGCELSERVVLGGVAGEIGPWLLKMMINFSGSCCDC